MKTVTLADLTFAELKSIYLDLRDAWVSSEDSEPAAVEELEIALTDGTYLEGKSLTWETALCLIDIRDLMKSKSGPKK
jgi:hypothetical protein